MNLHLSLTRRLIGIAMLSACFVGAQDMDAGHTPPSPATMVTHRISRLTTLLTLTSSQQTQATTIFTDEQSTTVPLAQSMRAAHRALATAVEANDASTIAAQATQIGTLTQQEVEARSKAEAAFYAILTPDQQAKYKQLMSHGPGGDGFGFRHPGPPPVQ
jgi:Spy/CpxP family protein refolding chaperone